MPAEMQAGLVARGRCQHLFCCFRAHGLQGNPTLKKKKDNNICSSISLPLPRLRQLPASKSECIYPCLIIIPSQSSSSFFRDFFSEQTLLSPEFLQHGIQMQKNIHIQLHKTS